MRRMLIGLLMLCCACSGDDVTGSSTTSGNYTLRTVNGAPLPYTVVSGADAGMVIVSDALSLYQGFTFAESIQFRPSAGAAIQARNYTGAWSIFGTSITLQVNETGRPRVGKGDASTITFIEQGVTSVYRK